jgi:carbonic anhydrase/acetyltransferase-like protein (isoleucine patch superfamily)
MPGCLCIDLKESEVIYTLEDKKVEIKGDCFIADNATLIGSVTIGVDASIWFNVVARGDEDHIIVGDKTNIQDGSVLHADAGSPLTIGKGVTVGHKVMLHGCTVGDYSLVGINAVVLNGAKIGKHCLIGANALVPEILVIPVGSMVLGSPAIIKRQLSVEMQEVLELQAQHYVNNGRRFNKSLKKDERYHD